MVIRNTIQNTIQIRIIQNTSEKSVNHPWVALTDVSVRETARQPDKYWRAGTRYHMVK